MKTENNLREIDPDVQHIFDSGANEIRVDELLRRRVARAYNDGINDVKKEISKAFRNVEIVQNEFNKSNQ